MFATVAAASLLHGGAVWAQAAPAEAAPVATADARDVEAIVIIGSQIRGARVTGALPVSVVGPSDIQAVGAVSADDLFRSIPQAGDISFNGTFLGGSNPNAARGDISTVSLRGLGQGNTLLLLNGRRVVYHPTSQTDFSVPVFGFNVNAIPVMGLARVEVLRDGAAALYGSDAVAGVVNNVLQSDYHGLQMETQYGGAESTSMREFLFNVLAGTDFHEGKGNISVFLGYTGRSKLYSRDQDFSRSGDRRAFVAGTPFESTAAFDGRSSGSAWGAFQAPLSAGTIRSNGVAVTNATAIFHVQPVANGGCSYTYAGSPICLDDGNVTGTGDRNLRLDSQVTFDNLTTLPSVDRFNAFSFVNYQLTPGVKLFSELGYYTAKTKAWVGSSGGLASIPITIPASNYYNPFGPVGSPNRLPGLNIPAAGLPLTVLSMSYVDVGPREVVVKNDQYRLLGGLRGQKFGFDWESAVLYSAATVNDTSDGISNTLLQQQLALSTPAAYNPFNGGDPTNTSIGDSTPNPASSISPFVIKNTRANKTTLGLWDFKVSNPALLSIWAGPVGVAAGVEVRRETYRDNRDPRQDTSMGYTDMVTGVRYGSDLMGASPRLDVQGKRTVKSAYAELQIPVISPDMGIPLVRSVELQGAGRFEDYSDVGSVAKPKIAGSWDMFDGLRFRTSWSQGFRAPNLEQLNSPMTEGVQTRQDLLLCEADLRARRITSFALCNRPVSVLARRAGNKNLKPEESESFSYGMVFQPKFVPDYLGDFTLTVDRWKIEQQGIVGVLEDPNAIVYDYLLRSQGSFNPLVVRAAPNADEIAAVAGTGLAPAGQILTVDAQLENLLPLQVQGIDVGATWRSPPTAWGRLDISVNVSKLMKFYQDASPLIQTLLDARAAGQINAATSITGASDMVREGGHPRWKWSATATWSNGPFQVGLFTSYTGSVRETGILDANANTWIVDSQLTGNLYAQYRFDRGPGETTLRLGVRNFTNEAPPFSSGGYLSSLYQPYARYWYGSIRMNC
jgi:outer membrane receptor protein involved in Fe transport